MSLRKAALMLMIFAQPAFAQGDVIRGELAFRRHCHACHTAEQGGANKLGPNLFGIVGKRAGQVPEARYSPLLIEARKGGLIWDERSLMVFMADPNLFLAVFARRSDLRSSKSYKVVKEEDRYNITAYLSTLRPAP